MAEDLAEPGRSRALAALGLGAWPDADMDYHAQRVRDRLGVPVALVSLVQADGQVVFPGQCGLEAPWTARRSAPPSHSLCHQVVRAGGPLVITDARLDSLQISDLPNSSTGEARRGANGEQTAVLNGPELRSTTLNGSGLTCGSRVSAGQRILASLVHA